MGEALRSGGLYRNSGGGGFHDADGRPVALEDVPPHLLTDDELKQFAAVDLLAETPPPAKAPAGPGPKSKTKIAGTIEPKTETATTTDGETDEGAGDPPPPPPAELPEDFPGREQLVAAGLKTAAEVFAHPNIEDVKGIGPKTAKAILELKPKAPEA